MKPLVDFLRLHWFLLTALVAMGAAYGEQKMQVQNLEQAVVQQAKTSEKVEAQGKDIAKIDERTKMMLDAQKAQNELLMEILKATKEK